MNEVKPENNVIDITVDDVDDTVKTKPKAATKSGKSQKTKNAAVKKLEEKVKNLEAENSKLKDTFLRTLAEFENFKKRRISESTQIEQICKRDMILNLLPILDDTDRLFALENNNDQGLLEGIKLIEEKFRKYLLDLGVEPMNSQGKQFDPELHDALMMVEKPDFESGIVIDVHEPGYLFKNKVLRHAKVIVNK